MEICSELTLEDRIKASTEFIQILSIKIEQLKDKTNVYNLNVLGYHTYLVGSGYLIAHNNCVGIKEGGNAESLISI